MLCCVEVRGTFLGSDPQTTRIAEAQANQKRERARINREIEKGIPYFAMYLFLIKMNKKGRSVVARIPKRGGSGLPEIPSPPPCILLNDITSIDLSMAKWYENCCCNRTTIRALQRGAILVSVLASCHRVCLRKTRMESLTCTFGELCR